MTDKTERLVIGDLMRQSGVGFGTSGARGLAEAMTDRVCYAYTVGFLQYLERTGQIHPGEPVALAGDLRPSTGRILQACARATGDLGYSPMYCGRIPSPAVAAYGLSEGIASLMVTGSHIPDDRNGIKFNTPSGEVLKVDELGIREQEIALPTETFDEAGALIESVDDLVDDSIAYRRYLSRYLEFFPASCLNGARVLLYEHSSVARDAFADVLEGLGAEVIHRERSESFVPVDTEAIRAEDAELGRHWAVTETFDAMVSTDGDGDRPLIGDERGRWLRGDIVGILTARFLDADEVVTPVSSNTALEKSGWFDNCRRTRIGSPFVIEAMQQAEATGGQRVVGFEANGGVLIQTSIERDGRELAALPTRDAMIAALAVLLAARSQGVSISQLCETLPQRFTASDRLSNFPTELSCGRIASLQEEGAPAVEALFPGLGAVASIDDTDGLRVTFDNDEVIHLRPSGNAPELRCYVEAASPERAEDLNRQCLDRLMAWREASDVE